MILNKFGAIIVGKNWFPVLFEVMDHISLKEYSIMKILSTISFILLTNLIFSQNALFHIVRDARTKTGPVQASQGLFTLNTSAARSTSVLGKHLHNYTSLKLNASELQRVYVARPQDLDLTLPVDGSPLQLELVRTNLYAEGSKIYDSEGQIIPYHPPVTYYGTVKGQTQSVVSVVFYEQDFMAMIADGKGSNAIISKDGLTSADRFIQYRDADVKEQNPIQCATPDKPLSGRDLQEFMARTQNHVLGKRSLGCIVMDVEITYSTYVSTTFGGNTTNILNWINGIFAGVHTIYNNEQINLVIGTTKINTSASEYNGGQYSTDPGTALDQFMSTAAANATFQGSFAHLIRLASGATTSIAYVDALCSSFGIAYSTPYFSYSAYPGYSWSVNVLAHESGHVFGSPHTHACVWNGNNTAIDGCGPNVGYSEGCTGPIPSKGTVMSYCHYGSGNPGIDFTLGFGTQPGNVIRSGATGANCANNCAPATPTCTDGIQNGDEQGVDCGGSNCVACNPNCLNPTQFSGIVASQSSTYPGYPASNTTDNNNSTFNHTNAELNPWLQLDLGTSKLVTRIMITNRSGCSACVTQKRLEKFRIYVSNSATSPTNEVYYHQTVVADGGVVNVTGLNANGRYVRIKAEYVSANYLNIADVKVYGCAVDLCAGNTPPSVNITTPTNSFVAGTNFTVNANAGDNGTVTAVEFYNGSTLLGTDATSPYAVTISSTNATTFNITAKAYDDCNSSTTSSPVIYNSTVSCNDLVQNGNETGVDCGGTLCSACVSLCSSSTQFTTGLVASQSTTYPGTSPSGAIDNNLTTINHTNAELSPWLQIDLGTAKNITAIDVVNRANCSVCVSQRRLERFKVYISNTPTPSGSEMVYNHTALVADGATVAITGLNGTGRYVRIQSEYTTANYLHLAEVKIYGCAINNCSANTAPSVNITTQSTTFTAGTNFIVTANATDNGGSINRVEFYNGASLLNTDNSSPYTVTLSSPIPATYTITAKAIDNCNAMTTSSQVVFTSSSSCFDQVRNGNETGVDCGGSCTACSNSCQNSAQFTTSLSATQSTTWPGYSATGAIDNNLSSFNHTNGELMPWLQINLGSTKNVTRIDVVNRSGCPTCVTQRRLEKFKVYVSNSSTPSSGDLVYTHTALVGDGATVSITGLNATGQYVRVWAEYTTANYLHLAEVKVFGCATGSNVSESLALEPVAQKLNVEIFPNPTSGLIKIQHMDLLDHQPLQYRLLDIMGRVISQGILNEDYLDITHTQNGYFLLELQNGDRKIIKKILKF